MSLQTPNKTPIKVGWGKEFSPCCYRTLGGGNFLALAKSSKEPKSTKHTFFPLSEQHFWQNSFSPCLMIGAACLHGKFKALILTFKVLYAPFSKLIQIRYPWYLNAFWKSYWVPIFENPTLTKFWNWILSGLGPNTCFLKGD